MASGSRLAVQGLKEVTEAFKRAPEVTRMRLGEATAKTAFAILQRARANVPVKSGALKSKLNYTFSERTGQARVGLEPGFVTKAGTGGSASHATGATSARPSAYGHLVEFGHAGPHPAAPHPFMIPATEAEREAYLGRCREAGRLIERDLAGGGGLL